MTSFVFYKLQMKGVNQKLATSKNVKSREIDLLIFFAHSLKEFNIHFVPVYYVKQCEKSISFKQFFICLNDKVFFFLSSVQNVS